MTSASWRNGEFRRTVRRHVLACSPPPPCSGRKGQDDRCAVRMGMANGIGGLCGERGRENRSRFRARSRADPGGRPPASSAALKSATGPENSRRKCRNVPPARDGIPSRGTRDVAQGDPAIAARGADFQSAASIAQQAGGRRNPASRCRKERPQSTQSGAEEKLSQREPLRASATSAVIPCLFAFASFRQHGSSQGRRQQPGPQGGASAGGQEAASGKLFAPDEVRVAAALISFSTRASAQLGQAGVSPARTSFSN